MIKMMSQWFRISLLLCSFGFFREMRPSEPFITDYLTTSPHNITNEDLNREIYPFGTYSILIQLVIVFLVTDTLRYKPVIILSALTGIALYAILLWTNTKWELLIAQVFYGTFMASEVAYYTYIYAKVERTHYHLVSGHTRSAILCGKFLAGVLAQVLVSTGYMTYRGLHYLSFASQLLSLIVALTLPAAQQSVYFYNTNTIRGPNEEKGNVTQNASTFSWQRAGKLLLQHMTTAYTNRLVLKWSVWWSLATAGQLQVISYAQILWKDIDVEREHVYNGAVEAAVTLLGAGAALTAGFLESSSHQHFHWWLLIICSFLMGALTVVSAITQLIWLAYLMYILFGTIYYFVITIASAVVAENVNEDSFGLIFGINTLLALILQTIMTLVVVTEIGYALDSRLQYVIYGSYFIVMAIIYTLAKLILYTCTKRRSFHIA